VLLDKEQAVEYFAIAYGMALLSAEHLNDKHGDAEKIPNSKF